MSNRLTKSELKAYRQRVNYHLKKGVPLKKAEQIASEKLADPNLVLDGQVLTFPSGRTKAGRDETGRKSDEKSDENLPKTKVGRDENFFKTKDGTKIGRKSDESRTGRKPAQNCQVAWGPRNLTSDENLPRTKIGRKSDENRTGRKPAQDENRTKIGRDEKNLPKTKIGRKPVSSSFFVRDGTEIFVSFVLTVLATSVLVSASLDVLGHGWKGWVMSLALEIGILYLAVMKVERRRNWLCVRGVMAGLMVLSIWVLHTGSETKFQKDTTAVVTTDTNLKNLTQSRKRLLALHDSRPQSHVTRRGEDLQRLQVLDQKIGDMTHELQESTSVKVVRIQFWMDLWFRVGLLFLNLVCVHRLMSILGRVILRV